MELLAFGKTGWGDELFIATLMTIAVSITAMIIGFLFANKKPIIIAVIETAIVINVAINNSSPQPVFPNARSSIKIGDYTL